MLTAIISAIGAIIASAVASAGAIYWTKKKEREAEWRTKKLAYYEEFFGAVSGLVDRTGHQEAEIRFATTVNNLHLIGSTNVIKALHSYLDEISVSTSTNATRERHDQLWSHLVWEIRVDLGDSPGSLASFKAKLRSAGGRD